MVFFFTKNKIGCYLQNINKISVFKSLVNNKLTKVLLFEYMFNLKV